MSTQIDWASGSVSAVDSLGLQRDVTSLSGIVALQEKLGEVFLRFTGRYQPDLDGCDTADGYQLPGLRCWALRPEPWWGGSPEQWVARQISEHDYLVAGGQRPWLVTGRLAGRGADGEPILAAVRAIAPISAPALWEAKTTYVTWKCRNIR